MSVCNFKLHSFQSSNLLKLDQFCTQVNRNGELKAINLLSYYLKLDRTD